MTSTIRDAMEATALEAAARAAARGEASAAKAAVARAAAQVDDANAVIELRGADGWLGPARQVLDARIAELRLRLSHEADELRMLAAAIEGSV